MNQSVQNFRMRLMKEQASESIIIPVAHECKYNCGFRSALIPEIWNHQNKCQPQIIPVIKMSRRNPKADVWNSLKQLVGSNKI